MPKKILLFGIRLYQYGVSPLFGPCCRFYPTCSQYAIGVISRYGPLKGMLYATRRVLRCHPFHTGGYDPIV